VVGLAEPRADLAGRVARRYDVPATYDDHEALLAGCDLDLVVAALPYRRHASVAPDVLRRGVPLFTEKPVAARPDTAERLAALADEHDVLHAVGYHKRSDPAMEYAASLLREWRETGRYGDQRFVRVTMPEGDWVAGAPDPITTDEEPPGGELEPFPDGLDAAATEEYARVVNYYVHQLNALRVLFGEPYDVAHADDAGRLLVAESESGITGTLERSPYETSDDWQESVLVGFDRGYVRVDLPPPLASQEAGRVEVLRDDDGTETRRPTMPPTAAMRRQAENVLAAVRGERDPPCDSREAAADLRVALDYVRKRRE
jgi:predicted dehydrogenase